MSGISSANNSWTILTPEETVAETLKPLAEGTEHHEESLTSAADEAGPGESRPAEGAEGAEEAGSAEELPEERHHLLSEDKAADLSETREQSSNPPCPPPSLEVSDSLVPGSDELSQSEGLPEGPAGASPDPDSFSDSYTHITPSPDEPPASLLSTETLGGGELIEEVESLVQEETLHSLNGEELQYEGEESDLFPRTADLGKQAVYLVDQLVLELFSIWARRLSAEALVDSPGDSEVGKERPEKTGEEPEPELRRRRSLLAALERIGRADEEEEVQEEFQLPRRDDDSGFSVNKCILGALILLGLGTIFLSGVFMDLDEESDYGTMELKDAEVPGKQEWLNLEVPPLPVDADSTELLNKLDEGNQQISVLQAQLQAQGEELKKELETLRSTVTELKLPPAEAAPAPVTLTTPPSSVQPEDSTQEAAGPTEKQLPKPWEDQKETKKDVKKDKNDMGEKEWKEKSEWKEGKNELKDGGKAEGKKGKHEQGKFEKEKEKEGKLKKASDETKQWKEKDLKKEKSSRGDEGKPWKDKAEKKEWKGKSEGKEKREEKDWNKGKHEKVKEGKQWSGKEEKKDWKVGKDRGEKNKGKEEWKKGGKDGFKESGKEKWEKEDRKEKGEKKEWVKKESDWKGKNSKDHGKGKGEKKEWEERKHPERKGKEERKQWKNGKDEKRKDEKKQWEKKEEPWKRGGEKDRKHNGDRKKDASSSQKHKSNGHKNHKEEPLWADRKLPPTHSRPSLDQPEYWEQQRDRLQQNPKATQQCSSVETCAQAEGLLPVPRPQFEAILQTYLSRAEEAGVAASKTDELKKLAAKFFKEGFFVHEQTSFTEFVEDLEDILEDMVEGDEDAEEEHSDLEDSDLEDEMEEFGKEVIKKFAAPVVAVEKEGRAKGEGRKERGHG
ncbi:Pre-B-cell leukemia transcription factor-interacting protein 1 [Dissostichus eleginoides]|uniref:Pre-B-cell leukemia transcription factor-interacting protein 1 n=1 Tax=Dissostichus eleginoides TaxID=100907 RepID=A0AAD9C5K6_DISEL|nr:Pre-B-cell leukemia transcription factor-interacting protein 1 [Dissostichus eleginoides]